MSDSETKKAKTVTGVVVSDKMDKSIVIKTEYRIKHPLYKKYIKRSKKYKAHDEKNECKTGDTVKIAFTRPLSKTKFMTLVEILERAK